jgi:hypothetical protein
VASLEGTNGRRDPGVRAALERLSDPEVIADMFLSVAVETPESALRLLARAQQRARVSPVR